MQKIWIKNNGPVKNFEMEIEKFNLLIGEQATGKSTIAKSVYYFKMIKTKIIDYLTQVCDSNSYNNESQEQVWFDRAIKSELKNIFIKLFGYSWDLNPDFFMEYEYAEGIGIQVKLKEGEKKKQYINVKYSPQLLGSIRQLQKEVQKMYYSNEGAIGISLALANENRRRNHEMITREVNAVFCDSLETYYIPAGRSLLTVMSNNRAIMNLAGNLDLITETFMILMDSVRKSFRDGVKEAHRFYPVAQRQFDVKRIAEWIVKMEKGEYFYNGSTEFLRIEGDIHPIIINFASSGQQEILWLLNFLYVLLLRQEKVFLIIEEPEAHIYPALQKEIMEYIAFFTNIQDNNVFITTHSPYILTAANNLYYAGVLTGEGQEREVSNIMNKKYLIRKGGLSAYKLLCKTEGTEGKDYINLLDDEEREIKSSLIDDVSLQVNELYTALYNIELDRE